MYAELLKAILIGICVAMPIGPVLVLVLERTLSRGRWTGVVTGIGSATVDTSYAAAGIFALSLVSSFIDKYESWLMLGGGVLVIVIGCVMAFSNSDSAKLSGEEKTGLSAAGSALQAMGCALSNPGAIAVMFAALALAGLESSKIQAPVWSILLCVFCGEMLYWTVLTGVVSHFVHVTGETLRKLSRIAGFVVMGLGVILLIRGLIMIVR